MIHQYINNGYHIVLDVNSGSVHSVDALLYDVVEVLTGVVPDMEKPAPLSEEQKKAVSDALGEKYSKEDLADALSDIQELIDAEELFTADIYKDYVIDEEPDEAEYKPLCDAITASFSRINDIKEELAAAKAEYNGEAAEEEPEEQTRIEALPEAVPEEPSEEISE